MGLNSDFRPHLFHSYSVKGSNGDKRIEILFFNLKLRKRNVTKNTNCSNVYFSPHQTGPYSVSVSLSPTSSLSTYDDEKETEELRSLGDFPRSLRRRDTFTLQTINGLRNGITFLFITYLLHYPNNDWCLNDGLITPL